MTGRRPTRLERLILNAVQSDFPVSGRPYAELAARLNAAHGLDLSEEAVWEALKELRRAGFIRRLGATFDARALGYRSTLCAAEVPPDKLPLFRELTGRAPQVTHNYLRSGELNAWFTFTAGRPEELDEFLNSLKEAGVSKEILVLDAERVFKIKVDFKLRD